MFKPGDKVSLRGGALGEVYKVRKDDSGIVETSMGPLPEECLHQAHHTVEDTILAKEAKPFKNAAPDFKKLIDTAPLELKDKLRTLMHKAKFEVDLRGHWMRGTSLFDREHFEKRLVRSHDFLLIDAQDALDLVRVLEHNKRKRKKHTKKKLDRWIRLGKLDYGSTRCSYCGEGSLKVETDGVHLRIAGDECALPDGFEPNVWELNVPSGKLVVENSLGNWFPLPEGDHDCDINTIKGCREYTQLHAEVGLSFGFVGNTCPGVYKLKDGSYKIANGPETEKWDKDTGEWIDIPLSEDWEGEEVAGICTDLWWYSICDYEELERRLKHFGNFGVKGMNDFTVIDVEPGVYRFRHYDGIDRDAPGEVVYADFERVRAPEPVKDLIAKYTELPEVKPHAYVQRQVKQWPTLYGKVENAYLDNEKVTPWSEMTEEERHRSWQKVADQTFFTIGSGIEWHENGWPAEKVDSDIEDIDPPEFRYQAHWYPFSERYGGIFGENKLSPSFAKFAMRCLESVISFGMKVNDEAKFREVDAVRRRMLMAVEKYREMMVEYPEQADPDYVWWLSQDGRAEAWVENFNLGPKKTKKHTVIASLQRWVPEDAYAIEFDARKLDGRQHFAGDLGWANKESATGFAIEEWSDNGREDPEDNCFWTCHAKRTAVPLYSVAKVANLGEISHMGNCLVELSYEYGSDWMRDPEVRKAVEEKTHKAAIRVLTKKEYEELLPVAKKFYEESKS